MLKLKEKDSKVLAVIPARGGSERLPDKILKVCGRIPLIAHTIEHGLKSELVDRVLVTTDSLEIMKLAEEYGAEVPFRRPSSLASNVLMANHSIKHAADYLVEVEGYVPDIVLSLYPTYPFREEGLIDNVVSTMFSNEGVDTCIAGVRTLQHTWSFDGERYECLTTKIKKALPSEIKKPMFTGLYGLANAYSYSSMCEDLWLGDNVCIVETKHPYAWLEIDCQHEFDLASRLFNDLLFEGNSGDRGGW